MSKNSENLSQASLTTIKGNLDRLFGKGEWKTWELETISDELGIAFDELARDKINVLQVLEVEPKKFFEDVSFFLHATTIMNNEVTDFDFLPMPNSLEMAYAIVEAKKLLGPDYVQPTKDSGIADAVAYLLKEEGFSKPLPPFDFVQESKLSPGQTTLDIESKKKAINVYIQHMESL